jgi:hypothetical protein
MKKESWKIFGLILLGIFLIGLVAAQDNQQQYEDFFSKVSGTIVGVVSKLFGEEWGSSFWELAFIKFLFWFLLFLIILSVSSYIPFLEGTGTGIGVLKYVIAIVISYLSVMYITPSDFYVILISYTTLGIVVTSIIPLAIIIAITYGIALKPTAGKLILQKVLMGTYALVLVWRLVQIFISPPEGVDIPTIAIPLYGGALIIIVLLMVFNKTVKGFILSSSIKGYLEVADTLSREEAMADAALLRQRADAAERSGATVVARNLREAAARLDRHATSVSNVS